MAGITGMVCLVAICTWFCAVCHAVPQFSNFPQEAQSPVFQQTEQQFSQKILLHKPVVQSEPLDKCAVADYEQIQCGQPGISGAECDAINCCFNGQHCYYGLSESIMGTLYSIFYETEQEIAPPESSTLIPAINLTSQRDPPESSNQHQHEALAVQSVPSPPQPDELSQVEKINFNVKCAGKSIPVDMFPFERISVFLKEACDQAAKKPEKMNLIYEGEVLDVNNTVSQYNLRGGSTVNLIYAS